MIKHLMYLHKNNLDLVGRHIVTNLHNSVTGVKTHDCEVKYDDERSTDEDGDIAEIIAMDLSHELSIFGLMAANIGTPLLVYFNSFVIQWHMCSS